MYINLNSDLFVVAWKEQGWSPIPRWRVNFGEFFPWELGCFQHCVGSTNEKKRLRKRWRRMEIHQGYNFWFHCAILYSYCIWNWMLHCLENWYGWWISCYMLQKMIEFRWDFNSYLIIYWCALHNMVCWHCYYKVRSVILSYNAGFKNADQWFAKHRF